LPLLRVLAALLLLGLILHWVTGRKSDARLDSAAASSKEVAENASPENGGLASAAETTPAGDAPGNDSFRQPAEEDSSTPPEEDEGPEGEGDFPVVDSLAVEIELPELQAGSLLWSNPEYRARQPDTALGHAIAKELVRQHPDGAFWLVSDVRTNKILGWGQYHDSTLQAEPTYADRSTFPAASLAKIITSVAALDAGIATPTSGIPAVGGNHTLYRRQVQLPANWSGPTITLCEAFAKSANSPMAILGEKAGGPRLRATAQRLGFNTAWAGGIPQPSHYAAPDTGWGLAESASGFTESTTLSPLLASAISRAVATGLPIELPWTEGDPAGHLPPHSGLLSPGKPFSSAVWKQMRELYRTTATEGTARKGLRRSLYGQWRDRLEFGGKTGSLDGKDPVGRYDWFTGYALDAKNPSEGIVITVMQYHRRLRSLPSTAVAGVLANHWAKTHLETGKR
jgi:cell division protein FtsI/penicillin-binding protein 2